MDLRLAASLVVRNEINRYLIPCVEHLLEFCDMVIILDDGSSDETTQWLRDHSGERLVVEYRNQSTFFQHEGRTRGLLLDVTLEQKPDAVLSVDADEVVSDGHLLRARVEAEPNVPVWSLEMAEAWNCDEQSLYVRTDGGWRPHELPLCWRVPKDTTLRMLDRKLACRRVPMQILSQRAKPIGVTCYHLGWLDKATRQARYDRYVTHDGGKFHASAHLKSIMWPDSKVRLQPRPWPTGPVFDQLRERFAGATA